MLEFLLEEVLIVLKYNSLHDGESSQGVNVSSISYTNKFLL